MAPAFISSCWRRRVERARSSAVTARCRSARAWPTLAVAASTAACSSPRVRGSSSGDSAGVIRASTVLPRTTVSPGSISMRCTRPETGAVTRNLSRTRVSPSSSTVTCIAPRSARTTVTSIDCGHMATATMAATTRTDAISFLFFRKRMPSPVSFESTESTEKTANRGDAEARRKTAERTRRAGDALRACWIERLRNRKPTIHCVRLVIAGALYPNGRPEGRPHRRGSAPCLRVSAVIRVLRHLRFLENHSRIFSTATRSSASSFRLTISPDTSAAPMIPRNDQATAWRET